MIDDFYKNNNQSQQDCKKNALSSKESDENSYDCIIDFFILNSSDNDEKIWVKLNDKFDKKEPNFDYHVTELLISNSINAIENSDQSTIDLILQFIFNILQHSEYVRDVFDNTNIVNLLNSIIMNSDSNINSINLAFNILDTYLYLLDKEDEIEIQWANDLLCSLNELIDSGTNHPFFSTSLLISKTLLEKGVFTNDEMHQIFDFYLSFIENLLNIDLQYAIQNFEIIFNRFSCFYDELLSSYYNIFEFIYSLLDSKDPTIVQSSINILIPIMPLDTDYFITQDFILRCLQQMQLNNNEDLAFSITNSFVSLCTLSEEACNQLIEKDFLRNKELVRYGYKIQFNLIKIIQEIFIKTEIVLDNFIINNLSYLLESFIMSDSVNKIIPVLDIIISLLKYDFPFNEELIDNITILKDSYIDENAEIVEKASLIIQTIDQADD